MKILLIDDHGLIREALRGVLQEIDADAAILDAGDWSEARSRIKAHPDLDAIVLDLNLPDCDGFEALAALRDGYPAVSLIVLSGQYDRETVVKALDLGALGFIPKSAPREVIVGAFNLVFAGGIYIPPAALERNGSSASAPPGSGSPKALPGDLGLTRRQTAVLELIMQGKSNKAICRLLALAEPTVKNHVTAILKTLNVSNRTEAVLAATARGFQPSRSGH